MSEKQISIGAEAIISKTIFLGRDAVIKKRVVKSYRHPDLDRHLRSIRTKTEAKMIHNARSIGVRSPVIYDIDLEEGTIVMEYIEGESVKSTLDTHPEIADKICASIGETVAKLHRNGIAHGDLTTSNMMLTKNYELCLIDFSLSTEKADLESMGVDIHLIERSLTSAHSSITDAFAFVLSAYKNNMPDAQKVLKRVEDIKSRARYT
ncbi:MAG: Kae1-associated serine/threonine protein kinase [archaeon]|nr:Kae1-associated serine/threonine protein kinase [archaeon]